MEVNSTIYCSATFKHCITALSSKVKLGFSLGLLVGSLHHLVNCSTFWIWWVCLVSTHLDHFLNPAHSSYYPGFPLNISIVVCTFIAGYCTVLLPVLFTYSASTPIHTHTHTHIHTHTHMHTHTHTHTHIYTHAHTHTHADSIEEDKMLAEGISRFCEDANLDPTSLTVLILAWKFKAATQCEFTRKEFVDGMADIGWVFIAATSNLLPTNQYTSSHVD